MAKSHTSQQNETTINRAGSDAEKIDFGSFFEQIGQRIQSEQGLVVTTLPRGTMQIIQPSRVDEGLLKSYGRDYHRHDRPAWEAILRKQPVRGMDCWPQGQF